ncbi:MAG: polyhydroxyalkanoate depolymerase [Acidimicrobiales bacterium]
MLAYQTFESVAGLTRFNLSALEPFARLGLPGRVYGSYPPMRRFAAGHQTLSGLRLTHRRPPFAIAGLREDVVASTPFADLVRFVPEQSAGDVPRPSVLVLAPLSGHFATLIRNTVEVMSGDHDVYVTDWRNAREVPVGDGRFGLDEYTDHVIGFLRHIGPGTHLHAVCQSCVPALVANAVLAADGDPATPPSLTLMAGPVDTRINPTSVNELATSRSLRWFERNLIARVPWGHDGANRRVYPGFMQVAGFLAMNPRRHLESHIDLYHRLVEGDEDAASSVQEFYAEYFAVLDMTAEFYLETVSRVFQTHDLARGEMTHHGEPVDPGAIGRTALLTIEGERDDICAIGQTAAAHDLCTAVPSTRRAHHLQAGVGHYGVFSGRRWKNQIYPVVRSFIAANDMVTTGRTSPRRPSTPLPAPG